MLNISFKDYMEMNVQFNSKMGKTYYVLSSWTLK